METIVDRLQAILTWSGKNKSAFAESVGMQQRTVYNYLTGNRKPKAEFLQAILKAYPDISPEWLLKGEGDMLVGFPSVEMANRICQVVESSRLSRVNFAKQVGVSIEELEGVLDHLNLPRPSIVPTIISKYPFINGEWLLRGIGSMYKDPNQTDFPETHMGWETLIANEHESKNTKSRMFLDLLFAHRSKIPEKDMQEMLIKVLENDSDALREFVQKTEMERSNLEKQIELLKRENELLKGDSQQSDLE